MFIVTLINMIINTRIWRKPQTRPRSSLQCHLGMRFREFKECAKVTCFWQHYEAGSPSFSEEVIGFYLQFKTHNYIAWFFAILHFQQTLSKRNFLSIVGISCCYLIKTWNDLSVTAVIVFNNAAAQHFQGLCQGHKEAIFANYSKKLNNNLVDLIITGNQLNNSDANSLKLFSLAGAVQQITSAPLLDLCYFGLSLSNGVNNQMHK